MRNVSVAEKNKEGHSYNEKERMIKRDHQRQTGNKQNPVSIDEITYVEKLAHVYRLLTFKILPAVKDTLWKRKIKIRLSYLTN